MVHKKKIHTEKRQLQHRDVLSPALLKVVGEGFAADSERPGSGNKVEMSREKNGWKGGGETACLFSSD
jgi:hypothetical protein